MRRLATVSSVIAAVAVAAAPARANGPGVIEGSVRIDGGAAFAKPAPIKVTKDESSCGKTTPNETVLVGPQGGLQNVVVYLKDVKPSGPPPPTPNAAIDQKACRYLPHVQAVTVGSPMAVMNNDAVLHNVHANLGQMTVFNVAMPIKGQKLPVKLVKPGVIKLQCDAGHTWMNAYIHVLEHAHFAVTDASGAFRIKDVPPGDYTLEYWHESPDGKGPGVTQTAKVTVPAGGVATADAVMKLR